MSLSQSPITKPSASANVLSHIHADGENCPTCDQPIPHDRFEEIKERIEARQSAQAIQISTRLQEQFKREKADALDQARNEAATKLAESVASARAEERQLADAAANQKLADVERVNSEALVALQDKVQQSEAAKVIAEQSGNALRAELTQSRQDHEAAIQRIKQDAEANAVTIRQDAIKQAEATVQQKIADMKHAQQETEAGLKAHIVEVEAVRDAAQSTNETLLSQIEQMRVDGEAAIEKTKQDAAAAAEAAIREKVVGAEQAKADAEAKALAAEEQARVLKETHEAQLQERISEVRTAMETTQIQAVNAAKAEAYEEKLKLSEKVGELQRAFEKKTAEELGEGAEVDLFEALKEVFAVDKIERVGRGNAGADIIHTVMHNGMECGKIIYDSKDHNQWRYDFVTKLASDKIAAKADHAILSARKFPQGTRQLHVHDGVIVANPARVVALVQLVREHIVKAYTLRLSNEAKVQKSAELYEFVTSAQFTDLLNRIDIQAQELQNLQDDERKAHEALWKKQSIRFRSIQKTGADLSNRVDVILGVAANTAEKALHVE